MSTTPDRSDRTDRTDRHPAQYLALAIGVMYLLVGAIGFFQTGFDGFAHHEGELLFGIFEVNPLHNIVHLVIGAAGVALWTTLSRARIYGWLLAVGYGGAFLYGLFVANQDTQANVLALNWADNWLHLASAAAGLLIALWPAGDHRRDDTRAGTTGTRGRGTAAAGSGTGTAARPAGRAGGQPDDLRVEHDERERSRRDR